MVIDPLAESHGHLLEDDLLWVRILAPRVSHFRLLSSTASIEKIKQYSSNTDLCTYSSWGDFLLKITHSYHLKYLLRMTIFARGFEVVLLQSFHELSALWFFLLNPNTRVFLIVTNNLTGAGVDTARRRVLQRILFKRAAGIFVGSRYEQKLIAKLFPEVPQVNVHKMRYHKTGVVRRIRLLAERRREIAFLGATTQERGLDTFLDLAELDVGEKYSYRIYGKVNPNVEHRNRIATLYPKLEIVDRYLTDDEYHEVIANAIFIALPFKKSLEGRLSGVLCDAISHGTPVIAANQEPHTDFFETYGDFGYLVDVDSKEEMQRCLAIPIESVWDKFQLAMDAARKDHSFDAIAEQVLEVLFSPLKQSGEFSDESAVCTKGTGS